MPNTMGRSGTSSVMIKPIKHSFTRRNTSGSFSVRSEFVIAVARPTTRESHNSSTSRSDRNVPVVSRTCVSTMKKPDISCVSEGRDEMGRGLGRMRSDCAFVTLLATWFVNLKVDYLSVGLV